MLSPTLWHYSLREVRRRPARALLTLGGIAVGVAAFVAVAAGLQLTHSAYAGMFRPLSSQASLEILAEGQGPFSPDLPLGSIPGVRATVPLIQASVGLATPHGPEPLLLVGVEPDQRACLGRTTLRAGSATSDGLLLEAGFATRHQLAPGQTARLITGRGPVDLPVAGTLDGRALASFNGGAVALLPLAKTRELLTKPGEVTCVQVMVKEGASVEQVRSQLATSLPAGLRVQTPGVQGSLGATILLSLEQCFLSISVAALVSGAFVILNTFFMNVGERRRTLALLRAVGATRRQVLSLLLREALLFGLLGSVLGLVLGLVLSRGLLALLEWMLGVALPYAHPHGLILALGLVLGPALSTLATLFPARQAALQDPLGALSLRSVPTFEQARRWPFLLGVLCLLATLTFEAVVVAGWLPYAVANYLSPPLVATCLIGCGLVLPAFLPFLLKGTQTLLRPVLGVEGRLAFRQLQSRPTRTTLTVGVLFISLAVSISFGNSFLDNQADIQDWYDQTINADFLVRTVLPDPGLVITPAELPPRVEEEVAQLPAVARVGWFRFVSAHVGEVPILVLARTFEPNKPLPLALVGVDPDCGHRLQEGEAVLGQALANRLGVKVGDTLSLNTRHGPRDVRIAGLAREYAVGGMVMYVEWARGRELFGFARPHGLMVTPQEGQGEPLQDSLRHYCNDHGLLFQRNAEFRDVVGRMVDGARALLMGLLGLVFVVSGLGIVNTLSTNVLEQTRELGVLRAVGLTRGQLRRLVAMQAVALVAIATVPGVAAGLFLGYLMNLATPAMLGHLVPYHVHLVLVAGCVLGAALLAGLAASIPARRAARLSVIDALRYE